MILLSRVESYYTTDNMEGLHSLHVIGCSLTHNLTGQFDLVFSLLTPAIFGAEDSL